MRLDKAILITVLQEPLREMDSGCDPIFGDASESAWTRGLATVMQHQR